MSYPTLRVLFRDYLEHGEATPTGTFEVVKDVLQISQDGLKDGQVLVKLLYTSVDPYMRGRMRNQPGYIMGPFVPGQPITAYGLVKVLHSKNSKFQEEDIVMGILPWEEVTVLSAEDLEHTVKVPRLEGVPLSTFLGALGMVGRTAYCGLKKIGAPKQGETVFVSGAAGAVGLLVGQLAKNVFGCHVVGSAGSDEKVALLLKLGYDAAFNYKTDDTLQALRQHCPQGIDVYFDNVGGSTLEAALEVCNTHARVVGCGQISQYNAKAEERYGVKNLFYIVTKRILMQGFIVSDLADMFGQFMDDMPQYLREGKVKNVEQVVEGMENAGQAFCDMMQGKNIGKMLIKVADE